jgi:quercetin dioxygenase-like cupin family protein
MRMKKRILVLHENDAEEKQMPGRRIRWLVRPDTTGTESCAVNMVYLAPGATVIPAHSHDNNDEVIYIVSGEGSILIDGNVYALHTGSVAVLPKKSVHMMRNSGREEMKAVCFFAPPTDTTEYVFHENVTFPNE